jgi:hypothetical protein
MGCVFQAGTDVSMGEVCCLLAAHGWISLSVSTPTGRILLPVPLPSLHLSSHGKVLLCKEVL